MVSKTKDSTKSKKRGKKGLIAFDRDLENIPYTHVNKELIDRGSVTHVRIKEFGESKIEMGKSWEELGILLLMMVHDTIPKTFLKELVNNGVLSGDLDVTSGEFRELEETEYRTVKIPRTIFKMRYKPKGEVLVRLILGCGKILEYKDEDMQMDVSPNRQGNPVFREARVLTVNETLDKLIGNTVESARIHGITFNGTTKKVGNMYEAVRFVMLEIVDTYGKEILDKLELKNNRGVGLTKNEELECIRLEELIKDEQYLYYNNSISNGMKFIGDVAEVVGIDRADIKIQITQVY